MFLGKGIQKICSKFTGEHPCGSVISIKLQSNSIEIAFRHEFSPANFLHIFRTAFPRNTSGWLLLVIFKINQYSKYTYVFILSDLTIKSLYSTKMICQ